MTCVILSAIKLVSYVYSVPDSVTKAYTHKGETILHDNLQEIETEISMAKHPEDILMLFV